MTGKTKKTIIGIILVLALIAATAAYMLYNKPHFSVAKATPAVTITATALHQTFSTDSTQAKIKFVGDEVNQKVIQVEGEVAAIKTDQQGNTIILLKTITDGAFINCTIDAAIAGIASGSKIVIKGVCTGYNFDADMGIPGDVIIIRGVIVK
jgi:uncharacterized protein YxeA